LLYLHILIVNLGHFLSHIKVLLGVLSFKVFVDLGAYYSAVQLKIIF